MTTIITSTTVGKKYVSYLLQCSKTSHLIYKEGLEYNIFIPIEHLKGITQKETKFYFSKLKNKTLKPGFTDRA